MVQIGHTNFHTHQCCMQALPSPCPCLHHLLASLWIFVVFVGEKWYSLGLLNLRMSLNSSTYLYKPLGFFSMDCLFLSFNEFSTSLLVSPWYVRALYMKRKSALCYTSCKYFPQFITSFDFIGCLHVYMYNLCPAEIFLFLNLYTSLLIFSLFGFWILCCSKKSFQLQDY